MRARVRASFGRQAMMETLVVCRGEAFADGATVPFAVMQATLAAVSGRAGISG
jgi:hypothetical protein